MSQVNSSSPFSKSSKGVGGQFFAIGTRNRGESESTSQALSIVVVDEAKEKVFEFPGFNLWNLNVDIIPSPQNSDIYVYFAGYIPIQIFNQTGTSEDDVPHFTLGVQLAVVRMKVTLGNNINLTFNASTGKVNFPHQIS